MLRKPRASSLPGKILASPAQLLRDLLWTVNSPSLIVEPDPTGTRRTLTSEEVDVSHLVNFFATGPPRKVGYYFERLVLYWLVHIRHVDLIAHTLQIHSHKKTVGEIDYLFRDEQGATVHLEAAVKFYLHQSEHSIDGSHFIGPNVRDTFERKMQRIYEHQLPLSIEYFPEVDIRAAIVKGRIFYEGDRTNAVELPPRMSASHLKGGIARVGMIDSIDCADLVRYQIRRKPWWLSDSLAHPEEDSLLTGKQLSSYIAEHFCELETPVLVSRLHLQYNQYAEHDRFFVIPDRWPLQA
ncbi:DUF1853 family protein [Rhodopirellula sallentina]|uniref:DUF1853 family protein n=1 Tax=Rhodopirellula sallentina TaxID=1263869 RepID=UPI001360B4B1|nr:DUF1853 family protein [Rhodopirellula sallentina]